MRDSATSQLPAARQHIAPRGSHSMGRHPGKGRREQVGKVQIRAPTLEGAVGHVLHAPTSARAGYLQYGTIVNGLGVGVVDAIEKVVGEAAAERDGERVVRGVEAVAKVIDGPPLRIGSDAAGQRR